MKTNRSTDNNENLMNLKMERLNEQDIQNTFPLPMQSDGYNTKVILEDSKYLVFHCIETSIIDRESWHRFNIYDKVRKALSKGIYIKDSKLGSEIVTLKDYNVRVTPSKLAEVIKNLRNEDEDNISHQYLTGGYLGWQTEFSGTEMFIASTVVGRDQLPLAQNPNHLISAGSLEEWLACCQSLMYGKMAVQAVIAAGFAAAVIGRLREKPIALNICGESSIGKSTISDLVTTINSKKEDTNIYGTFNSTDGYLESIGNKNNGVAIVIDDTSNNKDNQFKKLVYNLSSGLSRGRLTNSGDKRPAENWHTSFITSSESSFFEHCDEITGGMVRRLIEIKVHQGDITDNADQAEQISRIIRNNYGVAGIEFARFLYNLGEAELGQCIDTERRILQERALKDGISQGKAKKLSFVTLAAKLASKALGLKFEVEELASYLLSLSEEFAVEQLKTSYNKQSIPVELAYEKLCEHARNSQNCLKKDGYFHIPMSEFNSQAMRVLYWDSMKLRRELQRMGFTKVRPKKLYNEIRGVEGQVVTLLMNEVEA